MYGHVRLSYILKETKTVYVSTKDVQYVRQNSQFKDASSHFSTLAEYFETALPQRATVISCLTRYCQHKKLLLHLWPFTLVTRYVTLTQEVTPDQIVCNCSPPFLYESILFSKRYALEIENLKLLNLI